MSSKKRRERSGVGFVNGLGMRMILVKAGRFEAWTPSMDHYVKMANEGKRPEMAFGQNRPHVPILVELDSNYYLSEFPVTNAMYRRFVRETGHEAPRGELISFYWEPVEEVPTWERTEFRGDDLPVVGLLDSDAEAFCRWLSEREGRSYRLPTIYEWEFACRAGGDTLFWWGDYPDTRRMNFGVSMIGHPTPVGSYPPNPWGFHDLHGNVWEICSDGEGSLSKGSAFNSPQLMTGADVFGSFKYQTLRLLSVGFRLVCDVSEGNSESDSEDTSEAGIAGNRSVVSGKQPILRAAHSRGPDVAKLKITVGERMDLGTLPQNVGQFMVTRRGTWILCDRRSTDGGRTWQPAHALREFGAYGQLRDQTIMSVVGDARFSDPRQGLSTLEVSVSTDEWETVETFAAPLQVPLAKRFTPVRGLAELDDGRILVTMYGNMEGDRVWTASPVATELIDRHTWFKNRVIVIESHDRGRSWRYLSTVSYHPELTPMGTNESDIIVLPDGQLFVAMRTGIHGYRDLHGRTHLDQPLLVAWSKNGGRTWTDPQRLYVDGELIPGIYPRVLLAQNGVLAVLRTRGLPAGSVVFSPDGAGRVWSDQVIHFEGAVKPGVPYHAGMQDMALIGPNTILVIDVVSRSGFPPKEGWHAEGLPITVEKEVSHA